MTGKGSSNPRRVDASQHGKAPRRRPSRRRKRNKPSSIKGLEQAQTEGENMAVIVESQGKLGFPFYFPSLRKTGSRYADTKPRVYGIRDGAEQAPPRLPADALRGRLRRVLRRPGDELEVPADPRRPGPHPRRDGRKLMLYYDGSHLRLVAWRTAEGRLLGHEHADDVDPELAADRDRGSSAAAEVLTQPRLRFSQSAAILTSLRLPA